MARAIGPRRGQILEHDLLRRRVGNGLAGKFSPGVPRTFQVSGRGGVPATAVAVSGNLTVTGQTKAGYVFLGPNPTPAPTSSTLNFPVGDSRANGVTLALGAGGTLSATLAPSGSTDLIFDVTGYFVPDATGATYVPLTPARLLDTRVGNGLSGKFTAGVPRTFQVSGRGGGAIHRGGGHRQPDGHRPDHGRLRVPGTQPDTRPDQQHPQFPGRR